MSLFDYPMNILDQCINQFSHIFLLKSLYKLNLKLTYVLVTGSKECELKKIKSVLAVCEGRPPIPE